MGREIERKFRVAGDGWRTDSGVRFRQGYLSTEKERTVRVRTEGTRAVLTVKGITRGVTRSEFEYEIPMEDADAMLDSLCERPLIEKRRHKVEVDEFSGDNEGLVIAEVELESPDQPFERPDWLGDEVSDDPRYYNANLVKEPYSMWRDGESNASAMGKDGPNPGRSAGRF